MSVRYLSCGDTAFSVEFGNEVSPQINGRVMALHAAVGQARADGRLAGLVETVPSMRSLMVTYDPLTRNIFKSNALFLRGTTEGDVSAERFLFNVRNEYKINDRTYVFGNNLYLRDRFKSISYLDAVTGGVGYKLVASDRTKLDVDGGAGVVWEKNTALELTSSGAVTAGEKLQHQLTSTTTLTQSVTALWKTADFEDALYTIGAGIAVAVSSRTQLKFEVVDVFKNKPPAADVKKNDVATVVAVVFKS